MLVSRVKRLAEKNKFLDDTNTSLTQLVKSLTSDLQNARVRARDRDDVYAKLGRAQEEIQFRDDLRSMKPAYTNDVELAALTALVQNGGKGQESRPWNALAEILMARGVLPSARLSTGTVATPAPVTEYRDPKAVV